MLRRVPLLALVLSALLVAPLSRADAQGSRYCAGFEDGYKSEKGSYALAPLCPLEPLTPLGSTPYREGYTAGVRAARAADGSSAPTPRGRSESDEFCEGFDEGWKARLGDGSLVPICPIAPITPIGSTPYREGIRAGMSAAERSGRSRSSIGGSSGGDAQREFCDGYAIGWKSIKGDLSIVPICPIARITPIGSTPYREGLKAGVERARRH